MHTTTCIYSLFMYICVSIYNKHAHLSIKLYVSVAFIRFLSLTHLLMSTQQWSHKSASYIKQSCYCIFSPTLCYELSWGNMVVKMLLMHCKNYRYGSYCTAGEQMYTGTRHVRFNKLYLKELSNNGLLQENFRQTIILQV